MSSDKATDSPTEMHPFMVTIESPLKAYLAFSPLPGPQGAEQAAFHIARQIISVRPLTADEVANIKMFGHQEKPSQPIAPAVRRGHKPRNAANGQNDQA